MKIAYLSVSCEVNKKTTNLPDTAIARYINHILLPLRKFSSTNDTIDLVTNKSSDINYAKGGGITVQRVFSKKLFIGWEIFRYFLKNKYDLIHFQHEFFIYGGIPQSFLITLALLFLRASKKVITAHHVLDVSKLDKTIIKENNYNYPVWLVKLGLLVSYFFILLAADTVVVHEDEHKRILVRELRRFIKDIANKIVVIPHGIGKKQISSKAEAKKLLKLKAKYYVIFFGYVAKHKGLDLLLKAVKNLQDQGQDISAIVVGGYHPKLKEDNTYKAYYEGLQAYGKSIKNLYWPGFVTDEALPTVFAAADLAVFPYTIRNATSGSVTDAISYSVPFIVSDKFNTIKDFKGLFFRLDVDAIAKKILAMKSKLPEIKKNLLALQEKYAWSKIARMLQEIYLNLLKQ